MGAEERFAYLSRAEREILKEEIQTEVRGEWKKQEKLALQAAFGINEEIARSNSRYNFGPFYACMSLNTLSVGPWIIVDGDSIVFELDFLMFSVGVSIPLGGKND